MLGAIADAGRAVGLKPSGGIRTFDDAERYLAMADGVMGTGWADPGDVPVRCVWPARRAARGNRLDVIAATDR